jgi:FtsH-binding integral membrane protein
MGGHVEYAAQPPIAAPQVGLQDFLRRVFGWMFAGLAVTGGIAAAIGASDSLLTTLTENPVILIVILATIVNLFWANEALYWITIYAGVVIFAGLTAYDMQKLKRYAAEGPGGEAGQRAAIQGALALYLDFINLFLFLLRIFGQARS